MIVEKVSQLSGKLKRMELPITKEELTRWEKGTPAQDVWPAFSVRERESMLRFIYHGITPEEQFVKNNT